MLQSVQTPERPIRATPGKAFPSAEEIRIAAFDATREESVLRRLHAPFSYLGRMPHAVRRDAARAATRCMRTWIFDEPEVAHAKRELTDSAAMPLQEFSSEYVTLLGESCTLQHRIANVLSRTTRQGSPTYVRSIHDAQRRPDRVALFDAALTLFLDTYTHEQRRFAFGSSLKRVVERELKRYPPEWHTLLLTSTRGDFWSRYEQDLFDYADRPIVSGRERLLALYFGDDTARLSNEVARVRNMSASVALERRQAHRAQKARLAAQRIRKGYADLGDFPRQQLRCSRQSSSDITEIDRLLWIDNVLEKYIDHKHLLHHDVFLRLHLARLAVALAANHSGSLAGCVFGGIDPRLVSEIIGVASHTSSVDDDDMADLVRAFGSEAIVFAQPDSGLANRLLSIRQRAVRQSPLLVGPWALPPSAPSAHARVA